MDPKYYPYLIGGVIFVAVMAFRLRRMSVARPMNIGLLWITPVILALFFAFGIWGITYQTHVRPTAPQYAMLAAALVIGAGLGWWRGRFMKIDVHPETQQVMVQASGMAFVVLIGLLVVRQGVRFFLLSGLSPQSPEAGLLDIGFMLMAFGILSTARIEMWTRATRILAQAQAAKAA